MPPSQLVDRAVVELRPRSVLVVAGGAGALVTGLAAQGVEAVGVEAEALGEATGPPDEAFTRSYDLVLCLDALERIPADRAEAVLAALCARTDDILFSPCPETLEAAHVNVRAPEQWAESFARHGFIRDLDYDAGFAGPSAVRLRRSREGLERVVAAYERGLARLLRENRARVALTRRQEEELARLRAALAEREAQPAATGAGDAARRDEEVSRLSAELGIAERALMEAERTTTEVRRELLAMREAATYRLADRIHHSLRRALPYGSRRGALLATGVRSALVLSEHGPAELLRRARGRVARARPADAPPAAVPAAAPTSRLNEEYRQWLVRHMPDRIQLELMRAESAGWSRRPLVSLVMPVYNTAPDLLEQAIESVRLQTYANWELCIADDASTEPAVRSVLERAAAADARVRVTLCSEHRGIAMTSNAALELATGEMVTLLDHDDALRRHALHRLVELLQEGDDVGVVYTDEDKLLLSGELGDPFFKPAWSADLLLSTNYLCHLTMMRRELVVECGGFRAGFDGSQDHDLFLRVTELAEQRELRVVHLPDMLYIWRQVPGSAALSTEAKPHAYAAGRRAVEEALARRGLEGTVSPGPSPGWYHVRHAIRGTPSVAIVIPTRDRLDLLRECIESIERRTTWARWSLVVVDNDSRDPQTLSYLASLRHRVLRDPGHFNYSRIMNEAIAQVEADHVVLLNNDVVVITSDWLEAMLEHSQRPAVGAVGCRLLYPDGRPQHEGIAVGVGCPALNLDLSGFPPMGLAVREVTAVTGACMMMRRGVYAEMGGLDERLRVAYNDVDLCLRLRQAGYRVMYTPLAQLHHHESATRGPLHPDEDDVRFAARWGHHSRVRDPFLSPHVAWMSPIMLRDG
jgi:GT2 family glycosyltransferase